NGTAIANAGNRDRYNGNLTLNYNPGKFNAFVNYSIRQDNRNRFNKLDRTNFDSTGKIRDYYSLSSVSLARPVSHIITGGIDYNMNDHNSFGVSGSYYDRDQLKHDVVNYTTYNISHNLLSAYDRLRTDPESEIEKNATAYFEHKFAKEDHELRAEFNISKSDEVEDNHYSNVYRFPGKQLTYDNTLIKQASNDKQLTIDYTNPLSEDSKLEAGYDGKFNHADLDFFGEYFDTTQKKFVKDFTKSNRFVYNENVNAVYATYQRSLGVFGFSLGLRAEDASLSGHLVTIDSFITNHYFKIYPTIHFSYKVSDKSELQLNYSKRVHRPEADDINPFPEYQDPRNLRAGNPKLLPEIIHSFEFGYKWQNKNFSFVPSIYFRNKQNAFTNVIIKLNDSTFLSTSQNLATDQSAGLELIFSAKAGKFMSANLSTNIFYNKIDASNLGYSTAKSIISMSTNLSTNFNFTKTTMGQVSVNYRSARLTPQ
ncbi:MAG: hypothetical protein JWN76_3491, partial [Chitinophagaceae bacterium]|nr:hypothetical protein [Chitinophagaceae bacterium]